MKFKKINSIEEKQKGTLPPRPSDIGSNNQPLLKNEIPFSNKLENEGSVQTNPQNIRVSNQSAECYPFMGSFSNFLFQKNANQASQMFRYAYNIYNYQQQTIGMYQNLINNYRSIVEFQITSKQSL